ncbi:L-2-amino-thiazoline-4-carboxylic acid hydrolase [Azospirillum sp. sgz302134]
MTEGTVTPPAAPLPILERRRIEAEFAKALYDSLVPEVGRDRARAVLARAIETMARAAGAAMAAEDRATRGAADLATFRDRLELWTANDALALEVIESTPDRLAFNVTRCRYAETYRAIGVEEIGDILSCNRDGEFMCGYRPDARFTRTQTIMTGASHCDFRYSLPEGGEAEARD